MFGFCFKCRLYKFNLLQTFFIFLSVSFWLIFNIFACLSYCLIFCLFLFPYLTIATLLWTIFFCFRMGGVSIACPLCLHQGFSTIDNLLSSTLALLNQVLQLNLTYCLKYQSTYIVDIRKILIICTR